jgi:hypothetical protein
MTLSKLQIYQWSSRFSSWKIRVPEVYTRIACLTQYLGTSEVIHKTINRSENMKYPTHSLQADIANVELLLDALILADILPESRRSARIETFFPQDNR